MGRAARKRCPLLAMDHASAMPAIKAIALFSVDVISAGGRHSGGACGTQKHRGKMSRLSAGGKKFGPV
jgi:hypothetical protein